VLANLPRNGSGRATTRINNLLRHVARLRPGLLGCFSRIGQRFIRLTDRGYSGLGSILNDLLGVTGRRGAGRRGALPMASPASGTRASMLFASSGEASFMSSSVRRFCPANRHLYTPAAITP
jgi:hypothetical protein